MRSFVKTPEQIEADKARMAVARAQLLQMPSGVGMTCGACGHFADLPAFITTPVFGELPRNQFQCPACKHAFTREHRQGWIELRPCAAML